MKTKAFNLQAKRPVSSTCVIGKADQTSQFYLINFTENYYCVCMSSYANMHLLAKFAFRLLVQAIGRQCPFRNTKLELL